MTATPVFPQTIKTNVAQILPADTTTLKTLITAPANGVRVDNILISSTDTSARDLQLVVTISSVDYVLGTLQIPANAGFTNAVPTIAAFQHSQLVGLSADVNGNKFLFLASGATLKVKALTTVTAAKAISVIAQCGEF